MFYFIQKNNTEIKMVNSKNIKNMTKFGIYSAAGM